ncbi:MAG: DNA mismatch repair endonuclease MutL [Clostridiaceae bacterium]|jgi:DNA mismatch repair protein MutL|nr:DNA mismatch repair endonuclease MutL [Clostridiaceae bacterium]
MDQQSMNDHNVVRRIENDKSDGIPETTPTSVIRRLDPQTINHIAAGEVIERPASVAKELVDNALDAGASIIHIAIEQGGVRFLSCTDNGSGMSPEDARMALESHATSKLNTIHDLTSLLTLGFRGEALPSIASVSRLELRTRAHGSLEGTKIVSEGGKITESGPCGMREGTTVICRDLFFNTPARYKFLKKDTAETGAVADVVGHAALARPDVSFRLEERGPKSRELLHTPGNGDLLSAIHAVFGKDTADMMIPVMSPEGAPVRVEGYVTKPEGGRGNRSRQIFIVNGRVITSGTLRAATDEASKTWFMKGRFPQLVLNITLPGNLVDVNVHPQKLDVRFWDHRKVFQSVYRALRSAFEQRGGIVTPTPRIPLSSLSERQITYTDMGTDTGNLKDHLTKTPPYKLTDRDKEDTSVSCGTQVESDKEHLEKSAFNARVDRDRDDKFIASVATHVGIDGNHLGDHLNKAPIRADDIADKPMPLTGENNVQSARPLKDTGTLRVETLQNARLIGTLFDTYILLEDLVHQEFLIIDQHAAHERVLYEQLMERRKSSLQDRPAGQLLLVPVRVDISEGERALLLEEQTWFSDLGFEYEPFGEHSVVIRCIPNSGKGPFAGLDATDAFRAAIDALDAAKQSGTLPDDTTVFHDMACKAAVKAHDRLSEDEIHLLLDQLLTLNNPYHCPHGRPVILRLSKKAIEKKFGRIVG